jgi:hypothetical protein
MKPVIICTLWLGFTAAAGDLPLFFEPNHGQSQPGVEFLSRGNGVSSNLAPSMAEFPIGNSTVRMELIGAAPGKGEGLDRLPGLSSYFSGKEASQWRTRIPQFGRVRYRNVYPGIDLIYYGNHGKLEYDFVIAPGAKPSDIHVTYRGLDRLRIDRGGTLVLKTASGEIRQLKPVVYQEANGKRTQIAASYRLDRHNQVGFELGRFDPRLPLVVDPVLEYGTYFGGGWTSAVGTSRMPTVQVDAAGNVYMAGTVNPSGGTPTGIANVVKFSPSQNQILYWVTYSTGSGTQGILLPNSLAVDAQGHAYICGMTSQSDIPTVNAFQSKLNSSSGNGYVAKFAPDGQSLVYSTYLGGNNQAWLFGIAADSSGNAFVTGYTTSLDFPIRNAVQPTNAAQNNMAANGQQAVLAKFSPSGDLVFSTFFGGSGGASGVAVALDSAGAPILVGDAFAHGNAADFPTTSNAYQTALPATECPFVAKFTTDGVLVFSTLFGGNMTLASSAAVDSQNNVYLAGYAMSGALAVVNALQATWPGSLNGFIAKLSADGSRVLYSTYLGGDVNDYLNAIAVDAAGNIYAAGYTSSRNFPLKNSLVTFQPNSGSGLSASNYGFLTKIGPDGQSLVYSTLIGGSQATSMIWGLALTSSGSVYLAGTTNDTDFPTKNAFQSAIGGVDPTYLAGSTANNVFLVRINDASGEIATPYTQPQEVSLAASPNFEMFTLAQNGSVGTATFSVTSSAGASAFTTSTSVMRTYVNGSLTSSAWLSVTPTSGTTPAQLTVTADPTGMPVGIYNGSVAVTPASGASASFSVTMLVTSSGFVTLSAAPSSLAFSVSLNGAAPSQSVTLNSSSASASFSLMATTASGGTWLSVSPASGTAPAQATVSVNPQGLAAGSYGGNILATPQGGMTISIPVTLTVTQSGSAVTPSIGSVSPSSLVSDQQNQVVTVTGSGFSSGTTATLVLDGFEFPAKLTPVSFVNANTLSVTVRGIFLFQSDSLGLRLTNPGAAESTAFAIPIQ